MGVEPTELLQNIVDIQGVKEFYDLHLTCTIWN